MNLQKKVQCQHCTRCSIGWCASRRARSHAPVPNTAAGGLPTIYRTEYGGSSDQKWQLLPDKIQNQLIEELEKEGGDGDDDDDDDDDDGRAREKLSALFRLDARSDAGVPQHVSMD